MITAMIVILLFAWVLNSILWIVRNLGEKTKPAKTGWRNWLDWFQAAPVLAVLWVSDQAHKAKKHGIK
jgi:hypothetical protein